MVVGVLALMLAMPATLAIPIVVANEESGDGVDLMLIIDKSTSMGWNDPNRQTLEATYQLLHLSLGTHNRVGFVVYNDTIITYQGLERIETDEQIEMIMEDLRSFQVSRWTDAGLALQTARSLLERDAYRLGQTAIVYLSDGVSEFVMDGNPNRDDADVLADVEDVLDTISYPIFMVAYSEAAVNNQQFGITWALRAGGTHFDISTPEEMTEAIDDIYHLIMEMTSHEELPVYEHQLLIPIPHTETEHVEEIEITLAGEGQLQEITIPEDYEHITVRRVGDDFIILITNPQREYYLLSYLAANVEPLEAEAVAVTNLVVAEVTGMPWGLIGIILSVVILLAVLALLAFHIRKKQIVSKLYPMLNGSLECYFMEIPTGMKQIPTRSWSASFLAANNKTSLEKLLKNVLLVRKMPAAGKILIAINLDGTISIINKAGIICYKDGKEVISEDIVLRNGEGLYMVFQKNTIELELRAKLR